VIAEWTNWTEKFQKEVANAEDALALIQRLSANIDLPAIVQFYDPTSRRSLGIGVGRQKTVVTYEESLDPPYYISMGDPAEEGTDWFCYGGEESEYLAKNLVPFGSALEALRSFFEKPGLPTQLKWEAP